MHPISSNIKKFRNLKNMSQCDLAKRSSMSNDYMNRIERGKVSNVGIEKLNNIAEALGVHITDLIGETNDSNLSKCNSYLDEQGKKLFSQWNSLDEQQKEIIVKLANLKQNQKTSSLSNFFYHWVLK